MKLALAFVCALVVSTGIFALMEGMVNSEADFDRNGQNQAVIDFVRLKQDSDTQLKERQKKEPPKPKKPPMPQEAVAENNAAVKQLAIKMPQITPDLSLANKNLLGDAQIGMGFGDGDVIPLVRMPAQYPSKAKRRNIEGFVKARLEINAEGTVDSVEIIDSNPKGIFERSAIRALYKYKFKPKMVDGKPQPQTATQTLEFNLDKS